jgi:hypothetical protein
MENLLQASSTAKVLDVEDKIRRLSFVQDGDGLRPADSVVAEISPSSRKRCAIGAVSRQELRPT